MGLIDPAMQVRFTSNKFVMLPTKGYAAQNATARLSDFNFERRES